MSLDTFDSFANNSNFNFEKSSMDTERAEDFGNNSIKAILTNSQVTSPGLLKGIVKVCIKDELLPGKFKIKLVTTFEMKRLKNKKSLELKKILSNIKEQENNTSKATKAKRAETIRRRKSVQLWAELNRRGAAVDAWVGLDVQKKNKVHPKSQKEALFMKGENRAEGGQNDKNNNDNVKTGKNRENNR